MVPEADEQVWLLLEFSVRKRTVAPCLSPIPQSGFSLAIELATGAAYVPLLLSISELIQNPEGPPLIEPASIFSIHKDT